MSIVASRLARLIALTCVVSSGAACTAIFGLDDKQLEADGGSAHHDAAPTRTDAGRDAGPPCTPDDAGYHDFRTASCWETYTLSEDTDPVPSYSGAAFDGRYVYFAENATGLIVQYDTSEALTSKSSWSAFDTSYEHVGLVFDGTYLYLVPAEQGDPFIRYDTRLPFAADSSWSDYSPSTTEFVGYYGGTFDGRYVYFAPNQDVLGQDTGLVARYDTTGGFTSSASWHTFDLSTLSPAAQAFMGAVFDGRYVYLVPNGEDSGVAARYDTTNSASFASSAGWELFDTSGVPGNATIAGFELGMFDGRYVYFVPEYASASVLQFDTTNTFASASAWSAYIPAPGAGPVNGGATATFGAGAFDGRSLYFVPAATVNGPPDGLLARYGDPAGAFTSPASWSTSDTNGLKAADFGAAVFDGRYLYMAPGLDSSSRVVARFDARETSMQPALPHYFGSFF